MSSPHCSDASMMGVSSAKPPRGLLALCGQDGRHTHTATICQTYYSTMPSRATSCGRRVACTATKSPATPVPGDRDNDKSGPKQLGGCWEAAAKRPFAAPVIPHPVLPAPRIIIVDHMAHAPFGCPSFRPIGPFARRGCQRASHSLRQPHRAPPRYQFSRKPECRRPGKGATKMG